MKTPSVVILAPTLNEEGTISEFLTQLLLVIAKEKRYHWHIVIVDSNSVDKTERIVKNFIKRYPKLITLLPVPKGLGKSLYQGYDFCATQLKADFVITLEADLSNDPKQLVQFASHLRSSDLVVGSRYISGGKIEHWSIWRKLLSLGANRALRVLVGGTLHEYTNLYRGLRLSGWKRLRLGLKDCDGWLFVPSLAFEAIKLNLTITEIPIIYADRRAGQSKMDTPSYTKNLLFSAIRFRMNKYGTFS